ncbi:hypothetical protein [Streptomyces avidinii]|uniref:Fibronectin type-III domain-containing protein n=1 Tax=Streptomyces avidinii TaxID=1895 RepID=A0ABS4L6V8_STRAV|nr:hypothetical protein [Streptomyces avidinii]MBP2037840.1 hypothetical protein [Streptomyces avidinii]GGZ08313.1 hypothetical protein GCM10010343_38160 [Streptomyces avidinii]
MKLGHVIAAAVLMAPVPFIVTEPAAAANTHTVGVEGSISVTDGGGWLAGPPFGRQETFSQEFNLTHDDPTVWPVVAELCVRGQTNGTLSVQLRLNRDETVYIYPALYLNEESECNNDDLDAADLARSRTIAANRETTWVLRAENKNPFSPDTASARVAVTHRIGADVGRPREPSNVVASVVPNRLLCAAFEVECKKSVALEWVDNATNETRYEVRNANLEKIVSLPPNTTRHVWSGLDRTVKQCFQVRAVGDRGPSEWTPVGTAVECA